MRILALLLVVACGSSSESRDTVAFDLASPLAGETYWDLPFPSDLRLTADGRPDLEGFPNRRQLPVLEALRSVARERAGFPVMPIVWFRFTGVTPDRALGDVIAAEVTGDALLVDIDPSSDERGSLHAVVAQTLARDDFTQSGLVAVAPRPGTVLRAKTRYAVVLRRSFAPGVEPPPAFTQLAAGGTPEGARGAAAAELYAPLWSTLAELGVARDDLLVATVFTTGDEVAVLRDRSDAIRAAHRVTINDLHVDSDGDQHSGFCELVASVTFPQFQVGTAPFHKDGRFVLDAAGVPIAQGELTVPLRIVIPAQTMPATGWPLWQFFHGSGGLSSDLVDDGRTPMPGGMPEVGEGPGAVVARRGIAAASSALPVNAERLPNAGSYDYLNINNLGAFPYTFQQGVFEQRLLLDALLELEIAPATLAACAGVALPSGATSHHFDPEKLVAGGHSMGGMYTNMIGAVEPRYGALTPLGAGGFWSMMILDTEIEPGARDLLGAVFGVGGENLSFVHPAMSMLGLGWEIAEPGASMARLVRRPLPGFAARHVYQPIGLDDKYFPNPVFDAAALAYGNQQAGELVWPTTQDALATDRLDGLLPYPVIGNRGEITAVAVQFHDDGIEDAHQIHRQLDAVKFQYGCFLATYVRDGVPIVGAPAAADAPCP